ncbi:MAG: hypothetical protein WDN01_21750 [Rhizomicrobium sp.]
MSFSHAIKNIKAAIVSAPRNDYVAELHLQVIKYADEFQNVTGKEFCTAMDIGPAFGTEFTKMRKIAPRLIKAGLNPNKI